MKCRAITGKRPNEYGFVNIECGQTVGTRHYWTKMVGAYPHEVAYCTRDGHERSVRVRFAEVDPPEPVYLHEDPDFIDHDAAETYTDAIDIYKSWTDAGWTESELREAHSG